MGAGGGGGDSTQRIVQDLPDWSRPYWSGIASSGRSLARERYTPYTGERIAGFDPAERRAFQGVQSMYSEGPRRELGRSEGIANQAARVGFSTPQWNSQALEQYQNPYLENVLDRGRERMMRDYKGALGDSRRRTSDAAIEAGVVGGRGTLTGAREAGKISEEAFRAMGDFEAETRFGAADRAQDAFQRDVSARQAGADIGLRSSGQLESLARTQQEQAIQRISALQESGISQREMEQSIRDIAYNDFLDRQDFQRQQLNWYTGLLAGTPYNRAMNETRTTGGGGGGPGIGQSLAGLGIAGLGAYGAYRSG